MNKLSIERIEARTLLNGTPLVGWVTDQPGQAPHLRVNIDGDALSPNGHTLFRGDNLTGAEVLNVFSHYAGMDSASRPVFETATGSRPTDGNYEFTLPESAAPLALQDDLFEAGFFLAADFDGNRAVNFADLLLLGQNYDEENTTPSKSYAQGDVTGDGLVNAADLDFLSARYNSVLAAAPTYSGQVTVDSLPITTDGKTPLRVNWQSMADSVIGTEGQTISGYHVYRSLDGETYDNTPITFEARDAAIQSANGTYAFIDNTVPDGQKTWYRIRPTYQVTMPDGTTQTQHLPTTNEAWRVSLMKAPTNVNFTENSPTSVTLNWQDNSAGESEFRIYRVEENGTMTDIGGVGAGTTTATVSNLTAGATYSFRVLAKNASIASVFSQVTIVRSEVAADLDGRVDDDNGDEPTQAEKMAALEDALGNLMRAFQQNPDEDLAKVIQATMAVLNKLRYAQSTLLDGTLGAITESVDSALDQIESITGVTDEITEARDAIEAIPELPELPTEAAIRDALDIAGAAADKVAAVVGDNVAADALEKLQNALNILNPIRDMADNDLEPGNIISGMGDLIDGITALLPRVPGVSEMLDFYSDAMSEIGGTINEINNTNAAHNLDAWTNPDASTDVYPGATYGPAWAQDILDGLEPNEVPPDPMNWPTDPFTGEPVIPPEWQGYITQLNG